MGKGYGLLSCAIKSNQTWLRCFVNEFLKAILPPRYVKTCGMSSMDGVRRSFRNDANSSAFSCVGASGSIFVICDGFRNFKQPLTAVTRRLEKPFTCCR